MDGAGGNGRGVGDARLARRRGGFASWTGGLARSARRIEAPPVSREVDAGLVQVERDIWRSRAVFVVFLVIIAAIAISLYVGLMLKEVPGFADQRLGTLEELPANLGKWRSDTASEEGRQAAVDGLRREERVLHDPDAGFFSGGRLIRQVRYRDAVSNEIVRVEPDVVFRRRRIRRG